MDPRIQTKSRTIPPVCMHIFVDGRHTRVVSVCLDYGEDDEDDDATDDEDGERRLVGCDRVE